MLFKKICRAIKGGRVWKKMKDDDSLFLVFPEYSEKYTECAARLSDCYALENGYKNIVFVTADKEVDELLRDINISSARISLCDKKTIGLLMEHFSLHVTFMGFSIYSNVKIISEKALKGRAFKALCDAEIYPPEYIVENRMFTSLRGQKSGRIPISK